jgi:hypothetical protein
MSHLGHTFPIWESVRFGVRTTGATVAVGAATKRAGSETAGEDPLGARE